MEDIHFSVLNSKLNFTSGREKTEADDLILCYFRRTAEVKKLDLHKISLKVTLG
jgi:hypothetical protein